MALGLVQLVLIVLLLLLPVLWHTSHAFRYYTKLVGFVAVSMTIATISIPVSLLRPCDIQNTTFITWLCNFLFPIIGVSYEIRHKENLMSEKPAVYICNHQHAIDLMGMMTVFPPRTTALLKRELMCAGPFGWACLLSGLTFIDRSDRSRALQVMDRIAKLMHTENIGVWIYPEGTRNSAGGLLPFKKGAFYLAIQSQAPIIPVVNSSYKDFLNDKGKVFNQGKVIITCLPPISTEGLTLTDVTSLSERARDAMKVVFERTSDEMHELVKLQQTPQPS